MKENIPNIDKFRIIYSESLNLEEIGDKSWIISIVNNIGLTDYCTEGCGWNPLYISDD